jgi:hypothetical protein
MLEIQHSQAAKPILTYSATPVFSMGAYETKPLLAEPKKEKYHKIIIVQVHILEPKRV